MRTTIHRGLRCAVALTAATVLTTTLAVAAHATPPRGEQPQSAHAGGGVDQVYITDTEPGTALTLRDESGATVDEGTSDRMGSLIFRDLTPGTYHFVGAGAPSTPVQVTGDATPAAELYDQPMHTGVNYIRMRDGTTLAATVRLPYGATLSDGPFPTVIEYSGYQAAAPHDLLIGAAGEALGAPDPLAPASSVIVGTTLAPQLLGFATVSLQMRGSGCSGGDFGLFDAAAAYDGYDAIETVARQSWVKGDKVGMVGISFSGISQILTAGTRPPSLAAIAPMSTTDDLYSTGLPGGIYNRGFADSWLTERAEDAEPGPAGGQPWVRARIDGGDTECLANQKLRLQTQDAPTLIDENPTKSADVYQLRSLPDWASRINVPIFLAGAAQDEQTGPTWVNLINRLDDNPNVWVNIINGHHFDSLGPQILSRWSEFLQIFVANRVPRTEPVAGPLGLALYPAATGAPGQPVPAVRFSDASNAADAKARFMAQTPRVWGLFNNGGGSAGPGGMSSTFQRSFSSWPPSSKSTRLHLGPDGMLATSGTDTGTTTSFRPDPTTRPASTILTSSTDTMAAWGPAPDYNWESAPGESGLGFISAPLPDPTVMLGGGTVRLHLSSTAAVTDLQVTLTEVAASGTETYIGTGVLRSSFRGDGTSPDFSTQRDLAPGFNDLTIPIDPVMHAFSAGSRIRLTITAPGGDLTAWQFTTPATGGSVVDTIDLSRSWIDLPTLDGPAPTTTVPCASLRGQPCRAYIPASNGG